MKLFLFSIRNIKKTTIIKHLKTTMSILMSNLPQRNKSSRQSSWSSRKGIQITRKRKVWRTRRSSGNNNYTQGQWHHHVSGERSLFRCYGHHLEHEKPVRMGIDLTSIIWTSSRTWLSWERSAQTQTRSCTR